MTELIVALDGPEPLKMMRWISWKSDHAVQWFKIGPQAMCTPDWPNIISDGFWSPQSLRIFLDLKLADTADTVAETVKRLADNRIAAVSTYTQAATEAAMRAAEKSDIKIWQVVWLSDAGKPERRLPLPLSHGIICPVSAVEDVNKHVGVDTICPGIRFPRDAYNGHVNVATPLAAVRAGASYIVVGRPIWQAADPVAAAKMYRAAVTV